MHDGSITISTALDNKQLEKDLSALTKKIENQERIVADLGTKLDEVKKKRLFGTKELDAEKAKLQEIKNQLAGVRAMAKDKSLSVGQREGYAAQVPVLQQEIKDQQTRVNGLQAEWNKTENAVDRYTVQLREAESTLDRQKAEAGELVQQLDAASRAKMVPILAKADEKLSSILEKLKKQQSAVVTINEALGDVVDTQTRLVGLSEEFSLGMKIGAAALARTAVNAINNTVSKIPELFKRIPLILKSTFSKGASIVKQFSKSVIGAVKNLNVFTKLSKSLSGSFSRLGSTIKQALVFSVIYKGLATVREQMGAYLTVNTQFSTALRQLQGVLLTAFQPIYDAVVPALATMISALSNAIAVVTQFFASLFGTTAKQSQKNAKALYNEANALKATGEAADEAAGSLAGFDEINPIQTEKQGGGGAAADTGPLFDYEYEETPFDSWGEAFSSFLDTLLSGIPSLEGALSDFAGWLNDFAKKLYEMFTFPGVLEKAQHLGENLANALNGLVLQINWYQLGQALGAGLNLALQFLVDFIYTFDWINLGQSLAAMINGAISEIDWYAMGRLLWAGYKIAIETLAGFLLGLDMVELAKAASELAIGFFDSITETLAKIDWQEIGHQVAVFLENVDWAGVAESCFTAIGAAFGAAAAFLWGLIEDAWNSVVEWWHDTAFEDGEFTFQGLLDGIIEAVKGIGLWIYDHIFKPFIDGFKEVFGIHSPSTVMAEMGSYLMDGLFNGINDAIVPVTELFESIFNDFTAFLEGVFAGDWKKAWEGISGIFKNIWNGIVSTLESAVNLIIRGVNWLISKLNTIHFSLPDWVPVVGGKSFGINIPKISEVQIPRLAQGAVIPPNREFMAVLGDQRSGYNVEAPADLIRQMVIEGIQAAGISGGSGGDIHITVELDGKVVARNTVHHINDMTRQAGKPVLLI